MILMSSGTFAPAIFVLPSSPGPQPQQQPILACSPSWQAPHHDMQPQAPQPDEWMPDASCLCVHEGHVAPTSNHPCRSAQKGAAILAFYEGRATHQSKVVAEPVATRKATHSTFKNI